VLTNKNTGSKLENITHGLKFLLLMYKNDRPDCKVLQSIGQGWKIYCPQNARFDPGRWHLPII
jgi:hypothetical protein